jgi:hypothetical protein
MSEDLPKTLCAHRFWRYNIIGQDNSPGHFSGNAVKSPEKPGGFPEKNTNIRAPNQKLKTTDLLRE